VEGFFKLMLERVCGVYKISDFQAETRKKNQVN
jgi:hypothetical protein